MRNSVNLAACWHSVLIFSTSMISRWQTRNKGSLTDCRKLRQEKDLFVSKWSFLNSFRNQSWNAKILEQSVQNVLELYFILGCQAYWVCIAKHWTNKKQVPCQLSFVIGKLTVDVFCKEFWQINPSGWVPCPYCSMNNIGIGRAGGTENLD